MAYSIHTGPVLLYLYPEMIPNEDYAVGFDANGDVILNWYSQDPKPSEQDILDAEKPWAARAKRVEINAWAAELNSRAFKTKLPDAVDNMLTQDGRRGVRILTNENTTEINNALDTAFSSAVTAIETARDDPVIDLNDNVKKGVNVILDGFATLVDTLGSVVVTNAESKEYYKTIPRFGLILLGGEARGLMKTEVNALRDDPVATVDDILAYAVDDANASAVHFAEYPDETPTLESRLADYPADYDV